VTAHTNQSGPMRRRLRHLPLPLLASAALLVVAVVVGAALRGGAGAGGAALGVGLVVVSYLISSLAVAWADTVSPRMVMPVGLVSYSLKFIFIGVAMAALAATGWAGLVPMAVALMAAVLVWTGAQIWWTWHAKIAYVELDT
jgi:hypothetical protein